ncbi:MAG: PTS system mannose/fructose/sorbose family transporter subunit IID [Elusimicrobia bacterium]|nr:PTS system mannose/fructose/sorbose family transporter subunit IID [Elusimicrobiota bacterium]
MNFWLKVKIFARLFFLQACWNRERMQNIGFAFALYPALRLIYKDKVSAAVLRHTGFFNTQPFMAGFIAGAVCKMEETAGSCPEKAAAVYEKMMITKKNMASALAAVGDRFFWGTLMSFALVLSVALWWIFGFRIWPVAGGGLWAGFYVPLGILGGLIVYNSLSLWIRWKGIERGYLCAGSTGCGIDFINWQKLIKSARRAGFLLSVVLFLFYGFNFVRQSGEYAGALVPLGALAGAVAVKKLNWSNVYFYLLLIIVAGALAFIV